MDTSLLHPLPRRGAVLREQLRTVGLSLRREAVLVGGGMGALSAWILAVNAQSPSSTIALAPNAMVPAVLVALFAALAVWKAEDPARRGYHWSMPVDHAGHALSKALSGWVWLMAAVSAYMGWLGVMALATGGDIGVERLWGEHGREFHAVAAWRWLVPFVAATILYLFGTALALASRHPWRWLGGAAVGYVFLLAWTAALNGGGTPLHDGIEAAWGGRYGLRTAITGLVARPGAYGANGMFAGSWGMLPSFGAWVSASALWLAGALGVATLAARRQPRG
jgi:hypothetical protein